MPVLCAAVLLDMNGTFMFQGDRFGTDQDYAATYRTLGGRQLATVWIDRRGTGPAPGGPQPDWIVRDLLELL
ncbi:MAG: hypothetical protein AUH78_05035 [Gemmatimonadetes bacterium 13_1_40CM_4_69_8]|nr:MAG: hypothetical protein AUH78_05035 [Gemmatimonadetes bacterium 13_1_40CM_4_69_8]